MRKYLVFALVLLVTICLASPCFAAANNWGNTDTNILLKKVVPSYLASLGTGLDGSSTTITTSTTVIPLTYSIVKIVGSARTCTLANGTPGQVITLVLVDRVSGTLTITPATSTGWSGATMDANGEQLTLRYIDSTYGWVVVGAFDATVTGMNSSS
jgi:hypothetical protein